jgi:hypothetical protein
VNAYEQSYRILDGRVCAYEGWSTSGVEYWWVTPVQLSATPATYAGSQTRAVNGGVAASRMAAFDVGGAFVGASGFSSLGTHISLGSIGSMAVPGNGTLFIQTKLAQTDALDDTNYGCVYSFKVTY